jgi:transposase
MNRLKALYRSWGIPCAGKEVYAPRHRAEWLAKIREAGVRRRAEHYYQQLDAVRPLRQEVRRDLLLEAKKHKAWKLLRQIPGIGPIRAAIVIAVMQTPHRFRTKRQLWTYSGLALETHDSAQYRVAEGQLQRSKKPATVRGLNKDHNHDLKDIFKGAATRVSGSCGPLRDFYENLLAKGRKPTMARLTLARKIAAITLVVWKKEVRFDANYLKPQAA